MKMRYALHSSIGLISDAMINSYEDLPLDQFLRGGAKFRYRAFGRAVVSGGTVDWAENLSFFQTEEINHYAGGTVRQAIPLGPEARDFAERLVGDARTRELLRDAERFEICCHQIRIVATDDEVGLPVPEGFHRDGYDLVSTTCIATYNMSGGISLVREATRGGEESDRGDMILEHVLTPGQTLYFHDDHVMHYCTPITPKVPGERAYRDIVVTTYDVSGRGDGRGAA
jgi:hypothetical protein